MIMKIFKNLAEADAEEERGGPERWQPSGGSMKLHGPDWQPYRYPVHWYPLHIALYNQEI